MATQHRTQPAPADRLPISTAAPGRRRWLLFIHQLPSHPSNLRVSTWRRLQHIGAIPLKQAVYALPDTPDAREDFEWLKTEVKAAGGDASVFAADNVDAWSDDALVEEFRRARQDLDEELGRDVEQALKRAARARRPNGLEHRRSGVSSTSSGSGWSRPRRSISLAVLAAIACSPWFANSKTRSAALEDRLRPLNKGIAPAGRRRSKGA